MKGVVSLVDETQAKVETTNEVHGNLKMLVGITAFLVICVLALTYGEYNMGKALNKAFDERQMLLDRIEVLEQNLTSVAATGVNNGWSAEVWEDAQKTKDIQVNGYDESLINIDEAEEVEVDEDGKPVESAKTE